MDHRLDDRAADRGGGPPPATFLFRAYPYLKPREIKEGVPVWEKVGVEL